MFVSFRGAAAGVFMLSYANLLLAWTNLWTVSNLLIKQVHFPACLKFELDVLVIASFRLFAQCCAFKAALYFKVMENVHAVNDSVTTNTSFFFVCFYPKWTQIPLGLKQLFIACDGLKFSGISDKPILVQIIKKKKTANLTH